MRTDHGLTAQLGRAMRSTAAGRLEPTRIKVARPYGRFYMSSAKRQPSIWRGGTEHARAERLPLSLVDSGEPLGERVGTWKELTEVTHFDCRSRTCVQE